MTTRTPEQIAFEAGFNVAKDVLEEFAEKFSSVMQESDPAGCRTAMYLAAWLRDKEIGEYQK